MIVAYLRRNPGAGDTLEGIVRWWLGLERIESLAAEVAQVLEDLTRQGTIRTHRLTNGTTFYTAVDRAAPPGSS